MEKPYTIIIRSINLFLHHYQYSTIVAALLAFPFSASTLLSQALTPSSSFIRITQAKLYAIFMAAGFPRSELLSVLILKLSQSIMTATYTFPCCLSFLLIAKAYAIKALTPQKPVFPSPSLSFVPLYSSLVYTYLSGVFVLIVANESAFSLLFLGLNISEGLGFFSPNSLLLISSAGAVAYCIILANVLVICSLALVISGMLKAYILLNGKFSTALLLALLINLFSRGFVSIQDSQRLSLESEAEHLDGLGEPVHRLLVLHPACS